MYVNTDMGTISENNELTWLGHSAYLLEFTTGSIMYPFLQMFAKLYEDVTLVWVLDVRPVKNLNDFALCSIAYWAEE